MPQVLGQFLSSPSWPSWMKTWSFASRALAVTTLDGAISVPYARNALSDRRQECPTLEAQDCSAAEYCRVHLVARVPPSIGAEVRIPIVARGPVVALDRPG